MTPLSIRRRILTAIAAALFGPAVTAAYAISYELLIVGHTQFPSQPLAALETLFSFFTVTGVPTCLGLIVMDWLLETIRRTGFVTYVIAGALLGTVTMMLLQIAPFGDSGEFPDLPPIGFNLLLWRIGLVAIDGAAAGFAFGGSRDAGRPPRRSGATSSRRVSILSAGGR